MTSFSNLGLLPELQRALRELDYSSPSPIQAQAIPQLLDGRDVLACAQTGTGKTAAFALPVLQHLTIDATQRGKRHIRALVLTPTRELAAQISESFQEYGKYLDVRHLVVFGGVNEKPQISALHRGTDVLVATPGRLLDLHGRGFVDLGAVDFFVLDEADRMLDMGFIHDVRRIMKHLPNDRQNLLFSATVPPAITKLASSFLDFPVNISVTPETTTVERIDQSIMFVDRADKKRLIINLLKATDVERALVFSRTKHGANRLVKLMARDGVSAAAIHGNKSQATRTRALAGFRDGSIPVLVATDIAARGIDVDDVSHVFNYDLPAEPEVYVHRIGRTGRAGRSGIAISLCDDTEGKYLRDIERLVGFELPVVKDHAFHCEAAIPAPDRRTGSPNSPRGRRGGRGDQSSPRSPQSRSNGSSEPQSRAPRSQGSDAPTRDGDPQRRRRRRRPASPAPGTVEGASSSSTNAPKKREGEVSSEPRPRRRRRRPSSGERPSGGGRGDGTGDRS